MQTWTVALALALASSTASAQDDEANIERLIHRPPAAKPSVAAGRRAGKIDPYAAFVGQAVHVDTVDRGLYFGTLAAVDAQALVLDISLPQRAFRYTLPRASVAAVRGVDGGTP